MAGLLSSAGQFGLAFKAMSAVAVFKRGLACSG
jgi:hypothetical protein